MKVWGDLVEPSIQDILILASAVICPIRSGAVTGWIKVVRVAGRPIQETSFFKPPFLDVQRPEYFRNARNAQCNLGALYVEGNGVTRDYAQAVNRYRKCERKELLPRRAILGSIKTVNISTVRASKLHRLSIQREGSVAPAYATS